MILHRLRSLVYRHSHPPSSLGACALTASRIVLRDCSPLLVALPRLPPPTPPPSTADTAAAVDANDAAYEVADGLLVEASP